jgi:hypothetical protein
MRSSASPVSLGSDHIALENQQKKAKDLWAIELSFLATFSLEITKCADHYVLKFSSEDGHPLGKLNND